MGGAYSFLAMLISEFALSIGLSVNQSMGVGLVLTQLIMMAFAQVHLQDIQTYHEAVRAQAQSQLMRGLSKVLTQ